MWIGPRFHVKKSFSKSSSDWSLAKAYLVVFAESWDGVLIDFFRRFTCSLSRTDIFLTGERFHMVNESVWLPALQKHDGYQYIWLLGCEMLHRTASSPTHVE